MPLTGGAGKLVNKSLNDFIAVSSRLPVRSFSLWLFKHALTKTKTIKLFYLNLAAGGNHIKEQVRFNNPPRLCDDFCHSVLRLGKRRGKVQSLS